MQSAARLAPRARVYVGCVILAGGAAIAQACVDLYRHPIDWQWFVLAGLTLLSGSITVKVPSIPATISVSETFVFTAVMLFGPSAGTITAALDGLIISLWLQRKKAEAHKVFFNVAVPALSLWIAAQIYFVLSGSVRLAHSPSIAVSSLLFPLLVFTLAYFLLNSSLIAIAIAVETRTSALKVWRDNFSWLCLNFFSGASLAALLVAYTRRIDVISVGIIIPLLIISYLTYKTSMGRLEDATRHLSDLNLLYLSTIETLAMWIDAKDQITHGHIRRVQTYAVELAKELGVRNEKLIRAIEAAALLHDMGKLAVPEHILNKPGKLTAGEFEKMKLHSSVGAEILSAIAFPYPVVPIVRHHHESWDGTGYPDGLAGTDIPIGARILAVVDCFDALTSDRPYRPRLQDDEALKMLSLRRGTMYDPLVVDAFLKIHSGVQPELASAPAGAQTPAEIVLQTIRSSATAREADPRPESEVAAPAPGDLRGEMGKKLLMLARRVVPVSLGVVFYYDPESELLSVAHAVGDGATAITALRMKVGQGVSGWVAANKRTMANADSLLDLRDAIRSDGLLLNSCLSVPLTIGDVLLGVVTLYSTEPNRFSPEERNLLESHISQFVNDLGSRAVTLEESSATGVKYAGHTLFMQGQLSGQRIAVVLLTFDTEEHLSELESQRLVAYVDAAVRDCIRAGDLTIRTSEDEMLVVLPQADVPCARSTGERIAATLVRGLGPSLPGKVAATLRVKHGFAISPDHGSSFDALIQSARLSVGGPQRKSLSVSPAVH